MHLGNREDFVVPIRHVPFLEASLDVTDTHAIRHMDLMYSLAVVTV